MRLEEHFESSSTVQRNERVKLAASFWNNVGAGMVIGGVAAAFFLVSVRKHIESLESVVIQRWWPDSGRVTDVDAAEPQTLRPQPVAISE